MKYIEKHLLIIASILLTLIFGLYSTLNCSFVEKNVFANERTISLSNSMIDYQSVLNEFDNSKLITDGSLTTFVGDKQLDAKIFEEIDNVGKKDINSPSEFIVSYKFTYDSISNIVTLYAEMKNDLGEIEIDTITGIGFINEQGEIDAVMNIEGDGILLSEMRDAGIIQNCGWFSRLIKKVTKVIAVTAAVVVAAAVIVSTAGAAAPALVAAGVGIISTATTIATYATITAAIAAGVYITTEMWEKYYPGIHVTQVGNTIFADWSSQTKTAILAQIKANKNKENPAIYFECSANSNRPSKININNPHTLTKMKEIILDTGTSCITEKSYDAFTVIQITVPFGLPIFADVSNGFPHYHATDINDSNYNANRLPKDNPRYKINGKSFHSFWCY